MNIEIVRQDPVPESIRSLATFRPDYADLFAAVVHDAMVLDAEAWARTALEGSPAAGRFLAWRVLCNLDLGPQSTDGYIAGWRVVTRGENSITLEARSWFMRANIVLRATHRRVDFATLIRYDLAVGRAIWGTVSVIHRRVAPDFLRAGVTRAIKAGRSTGGDMRHATPAPETVTTEWAEAFIEQWLAAFNSGEPERVVELMTDDAVFDDPAAPDTMRGRAEIQSFLEYTFGVFPDLTIERLGGPLVASDGSRAAFMWTAHATFAGPIEQRGISPTGKRVEKWEGADFHEYRDGKVVRLHILYDLADVLRQMGLLPESVDKQV